MGITQTYDFDSAPNFTLSDTEIDTGVARLSIIPNPGQVFSEAFTSSAGFTYDAAKAEFTGGLVRAKDLRPTNAKIGATYTSSKDLSWSNGGSLTNTDIGTPVLSGGKVACLGQLNNALTYTNSDIGSCGDTGAMKLKYTPNYSGAPTNNVNVFELRNPSNVNDLILLLHSSTGTFRITMYTSVGTVKHSAAIIGAPWLPVAGTEYEIEMDWSCVAGQIRLFVNGALIGACPVSSFARGTSATKLYVGAGATYPVADGSFNDVVMFDVVQHTAAYTAGYTLEEYIYLESKVDGPSFAYTGIGTILSIDSKATTEVGAPHYILESKYWNGSAWVASDGSYAQSNTFAVALANLLSLTAIGGSVSWSIVFPSSNTLSSVDSYSVTVTGQRYSPTGHVEPVQGIDVASLIAYSDTHIENANTDLRLILKIDGVLKWWNGSAWAASNGTVAEGNTAAEVTTGIPSLVLGVNSTIVPRWVMSTSVATETPTIDTSSISYNFGAIETPLVTCEVFGYLKNISDVPVSGATIKFELNQKTSKYKEANNNVINTLYVETTTDVNGYFTVPLVRSSEYIDATTYYRMTITKGEIIISKSGNGKMLFQVPDAVTKDITDLLPTV